MKRLFPILAIALYDGIRVCKCNYIHEHYMNTLTTIVTPVQDEAASAVQKNLGFHQELKKRFIEGGPGFMGIVLLCLILGLSNCY